MREFSTRVIQPKIPEGFKYLEGTPTNGFVIQSMRGNQFVWVPVQALIPNGTGNNGKTFENKLGRRMFEKEIELTIDEFWEDESSMELRRQRQLVEVYGGFYVSRYAISEGCKSIPNRIPVVEMNLYEAIDLAKKVEHYKEVESRLIYGCEYDSILEWLIESGEKSVNEVTMWNQTSWGNLFKMNGTNMGISISDAKLSWQANKMFDLNGNVRTWTLERFKKTSCGVIRGTGWKGAMSVDHRQYSYPQLSYDDCGFRVVLQWKC